MHLLKLACWYLNFNLFLLWWNILLQIQKFLNWIWYEDSVLLFENSPTIRITNTTGTVWWNLGTVMWTRSLFLSIWCHFSAAPIQGILRSFWHLFAKRVKFHTSITLYYTKYSTLLSSNWLHRFIKGKKNTIWIFSFTKKKEGHSSTTTFTESDDEADD